MTEYIDREKLLKNVEMKGRWGFSGTAIYQAIKDAPAADVVEVVRCKDCVCRSGSSTVVHHCTLSGIPVDGDDFCSYGERDGADDRP